MAEKDFYPLRHELDRRFDEQELRSLCFDLRVDYDNLPGEGKVNKARELVAYMARRGRLDDLAKVGRRLRPDIDWEALIQAPQVITAATRRVPSTRSREAHVPLPGESELGWTGWITALVVGAVMTGATKFLSYHLLLTLDNSPDRYEQAASLSNTLATVVGVGALIFWLILTCYLAYRALNH